MYKKPPSPTPIGKDGNHTASVRHKKSNDKNIVPHSPEKVNPFEGEIFAPFFFRFLCFKDFFKKFFYNF